MEIPSTPIAVRLRIYYLQSHVISLVHRFEKVVRGKFFVLVAGKVCLNRRLAIKPESFQLRRDDQSQDIAPFCTVQSAHPLDNFHLLRCHGHILCTATTHRFVALVISLREHLQELLRVVLYKLKKLWVRLS